MCTCENNSCTWAGDLQLPIIGTNEPMMTPYIDPRTASKHVLIPSYFIQVI